VKKNEFQNTLKPRSLFTNFNFLLLWIGQTISIIGDNLFQIALMWWVLEKTGSTAAMATVAICAALPVIIAGPFAGTYVDRVNRKKLMIWMDLLRGILISVPGILFFWGKLEVWHIYGASLGLASMTAFFNPAINSFIPLLVPRESLTRANSLNQLSRNLSGILGPALGGILVALLGSGWVMILDGITFGLSGLAILFIRGVEVIVSETKLRQHFFADLWEGLVFIKNQSVIFWNMILFSLINFFIAPIAILIPVMVKEVLRMGPEGFGFLTSAISVGMFLGTLFLGIKGDVKRKGPVIILSIIFGGICLALFGVSTSFSLSMLLLGLAGLTFSLVNVLIIVVFQTGIPHDKQGRIFGSLNTVVWGLRPISLALAGVLAVWVDVHVLIFFSGVLVAFGGLFSSLIKGMRQL
jgi:DHA3 family macrolide efflux protein-like MFS transporter